MVQQWPKVVVEFEKFLEERGLRCHQRIDEDQGAFGNKLLLYGNADIALRIILDRGSWSIEVAEVATHTNKWYDAELLRNLLSGEGKQGTTLADEIDFIRSNWQVIVSIFDETSREDTHARLAVLGSERARRLFPGIS